MQTEIGTRADTIKNEVAGLQTKIENAARGLQLRFGASGRGECG
jgi:hypothetical protein